MRVLSSLATTDRAASSSMNPKSQLENSVGKHYEAGNERQEPVPEGFKSDLHDCIFSALLSKSRNAAID